MKKVVFTILCFLVAGLSTGPGIHSTFAQNLFIDHVNGDIRNPGHYARTEKEFHVRGIPDKHHGVSLRHGPVNNAWRHTPNDVSNHMETSNSSDSECRLIILGAVS